MQFDQLRRREFITLLGGAAAWPLAAHAQQGKIPGIGVLWHAGSEEEEAIYLTALRQGFRDVGYIEGRTFVLENRFPNEQLGGLSRVALLVNPNDELMSRRYNEESQAAAAKLGLTIQPVEVRSFADFERAFNEITEARLQAVIVGPNGVFFQGREVMAQMALKRRLPLIVYSKETFDAGAPLSYGADQIPIFRRAAVFVDKILKGAKPADLPVELPTRFQFRINLKVAGALGIVIPPVLLARADEVIE
jgi:ABC-type uncharacterized transport system substrate-binding protein